MTYVFPNRIDAGNATWKERAVSDDTQDANTEPGSPEVNLDASNLPCRPGIPSPYPPSRADWFDVDGIYEVKTTPPNNERRLMAERIERIVLRLQDAPQYLGRVEVLLGLDLLESGV